MKTLGLQYYSISAATGSGVKEVMLYVTELLDTIEIEPLYSAEELLNVDDEVFSMDPTIHYSTFEVDNAEKEIIYIAEGVRLERLIYSTNFEDIESLRRFQMIIKQMEIFGKFKEMGCRNGDTVRIEDKEFEYFE